MANETIHYFTTDGKETSEGALDSVVQYDEATATKLGLKFKSEGEVKVDAAEVKAATAAAFAGARADGSETTPVLAPKAAPEPEVVEEPAPRKSRKKG